MPDSVDWSRNVGKYRIQRDLLALSEPARILDVGAVGSGELDLWRPLPVDRMPVELVAVDIDTEALDRARALDLPIELRQVNGYELSEAFEPSSFDLVINTQVIQYLARPVDHLREIAAVLKPRGQLWATLDSPGSHGQPLWKRIVRRIAARVTERYHQAGLTEQQVREYVSAAGLRVEELMHCNLGPVKPMVNRLSSERAWQALPTWYELERQLAPSAEPSAFLGIYLDLREPALPEDIAKAERALGARFPESYKR